MTVPTASMSTMEMQASVNSAVRRLTGMDATIVLPASIVMEAEVANADGAVQRHLGAVAITLLMGSTNNDGG